MSKAQVNTDKARSARPARRCLRSSARAVLREDPARPLPKPTGVSEGRSAEELRGEITRRRQAERELRSAKDALERRAAQLHALALELTRAEERERQRVADVLHGDVQQLLVAARWRAALLARSQAEPAERARDLASLAAVLDDALQASRSLSHDLAPPILGTGSFSAVLEWLAARMKHLHDLDVTVLAPEPLAVDSDMVRTLLFRAVRELLLNVAKHAAAREATVEAELKGDHLCVTVADKGRGFDATAIQTSAAGQGLPSVRERLGLVGGSLAVTSSPDKGTSVTIQLPVRGVDLPVLGAPN